jgi:hypothetical protein
MNNTINIAGLDKAAVLAALYNNSFQLGMGVLHTRGQDGMTVEQAREELAAFGDRRPYFDYLHGRVMKSEISGDSYDPWGYDRDNGLGAAANALAHLIEARDAAATP